MGCFAKGCLILLAFAFLLTVAFIGGTYYAWHRIFPTKGMDLPRTTITEEQTQSAEQRWNAFKDAADLRRPARIELTADDINALIGAGDPEWRGRFHVSISENVGRVRISFPMDQSGWLKGHYINAEGRVQPAPDKSPSDAQVTSIVLNGQSVPNDFVQWEFFGWSLRDQIAEWCEEYNLKTFDIQNGRVILETRGE